jgi:hypothetical protein
MLVGQRSNFGSYPWSKRRGERVEHMRAFDPELDLFPSTILPGGTAAKIRHGTLPPKRPTRSSERNLTAD